MKVKDFINKLEEYGYDENTEITFGSCSYGGDWYEFYIEEFGYDGSYGIEVLFEPNEDYQKVIFSEACDDLVNDIKDLLAEYYQSIKTKVSKDKNNHVGAIY